MTEEELEKEALRWAKEDQKENFPNWMEAFKFAYELGFDKGEDKGYTDGYRDCETGV